MCIRDSGTSGLTARDTQHPSYITANSTLKRITASVQSLGLWFNTTYPELRPTVDGEIIIPAGTIHCDAVDTTKRYAVRGRKLYDLSTRSFNFSGPETFKLVVSLDIEDMPYAAQDYVRALAKYTFYVDEDGTQVKLQAYDRERNECWSALYREHLKSRDINHFNSPAALRLKGNYGGRYIGNRHLPRPKE